MAANGPIVISFLNAHAANLAWRDKSFSKDLLGSDVLVRDGIGLRILLLMLGRKPGLNLNGTDLIPEILEALPRTKSLAVYGTKEPFLSSVVTKIRDMDFRIADTNHGFHGDDHYVGRMLKTSPDVILLAMGMPKQERIAAALKGAAGDRSLLIINGGAIVDFLGGRFTRAPVFLQKIGMEWLYRLIKEPGRLWQRYIIGNTIFIFRTITLCLTRPFLSKEPSRANKKKP
jgi:exopolysaccharide biosynthesis WecB/TagA/CpsF family protein